MFAAYTRGEAQPHRRRVPLAQGRHGPAGRVRRDADPQGRRPRRRGDQLHRHHRAPARRARLRETEQFFRSVLELAPDGLMIVNARGVIQLANAQCEILFGYPRKELVGQPVEMLVPAEDPRPARGHARVVPPLAGGPRDGLGARAARRAQGRQRIPGGDRPEPAARPAGRGGAGRRLGPRHHRAPPGRGGAADPAQRPRGRGQRHRHHRQRGRHPVGQSGLRPADRLRARRRPWARTPACSTPACTTGSSSGRCGRPCWPARSGRARSRTGARTACSIRRR